jgi:hypothetical protein
MDHGAAIDGSTQDHAAMQISQLQCQEFKSATQITKIDDAVFKVEYVQISRLI